MLTHTAMIAALPDAAEHVSEVAISEASIQEGTRLEGMEAHLPSETEVESQVCGRLAVCKLVLTYRRRTKTPTHRVTDHTSISLVQAMRAARYIAKTTTTRAARQSPTSRMSQR